jgi:hypothetical protein
MHSPLSSSYGDRFYFIGTFILEMDITQLLRRAEARKFKKTVTFVKLGDYVCGTAATNRLILSHPHIIPE